MSRSRPKLIMKLDGLILFHGQSVPVKDNYFYVSEVVKEKNKRINDFTTSKSTKDYLKALEGETEISVSELIKTNRGGIEGGYTAIHRDIIILFARWLDPKFAIACDRFIISEFDKLEEKRMIAQKQLDYFWDQEDIKDLYKG